MEASRLSLAYHVLRNMAGYGDSPRIMLLVTFTLITLGAYLHKVSLRQWGKRRRLRICGHHHALKTEPASVKVACSLHPFRR